MPKAVNKPRAVFIERGGNTWFVRYQERQPRQRYSAATFYAPDHTLEWVKAWVQQNPKLVLVDVTDVKI